MGHRHCRKGRASEPLMQVKLPSAVCSVHLPPTEQKQMKTPAKDAPPADEEKPREAPKPSRMEERLKMVEEYINSQREFLRALRKRFFH